MLSSKVTFDTFGNLCPHDVISCDLNKCQKVFVYAFPDSNTRPLLFESYIAYRKAIFSVIGYAFKQWINGSFVTQKQNPNDVDLANLIPYNDSLDAQIEQILPYFTVGGSIETYQIDAHLIPVYQKSDPRFENTELRISYFKRWFGHDRNDNPKGFIEINEP